MIRITTAAILLAGALAACEGPTDTGSLEAALSIAPVFAPGTLASPVSVDRVRLRLARSAAEKVLDSTVVFPADSAQISVVLRVPLQARSEKLLLTVDLMAGTQVLYSATELVTLYAEAQGPTPTPHPVVVYVGPGANATTIHLSPRDTAITFGDSFTFRVSGTTNTGGAVNDLLLLWSSSLAAAAVSTDGRVTALSSRTTIKLRVFTPAGVGDSTTVRFVPAPAALALAGIATQSGPVGSVLPNPFQVQVRGADGLGVPNIRVNFRALTAGGVVANLLVHTDQAGFASTAMTLGATAGQYTFEASVTGLPAVTVVANATP